MSWLTETCETFLGPKPTKIESFLSRKQKKSRVPPYKTIGFCESKDARIAWFSVSWLTETCETFVGPKPTKIESFLNRKQKKSRVSPYKTIGFCELKHVRITWFSVSWLTETCETFLGPKPKKARVSPYKTIGFCVSKGGMIEWFTASWLAGTCETFLS